MNFYFKKRVPYYLPCGVVRRNRGIFVSLKTRNENLLPPPPPSPRYREIDDDRWTYRKRVGHSRTHEYYRYCNILLFLYYCTHTKRVCHVLTKYSVLYLYLYIFILSYTRTLRQSVGAFRWILLQLQLGILVVGASRCSAIILLYSC